MGNAKIEFLSVVFPKCSAINLPSNVGTIHGAF
jgi:hypothetical protein